MPVSIQNITLEAINGKTYLNWNTASELNTSHFIIQRSTDGINFANQGNVSAVGSGANKYHFTDNNPTSGTNYYRLQSVDKDGHSAFSKVVSVQLAVNNNQLTVFPNPGSDKVTIRGNHIVLIQVLDNIGRLVNTVSLKDATNPTLSLNSLLGGNYHLRIQTTDGKFSSVGFIKE